MTQTYLFVILTDFTLTYIKHFLKCKRLSNYDHIYRLLNFIYVKEKFPYSIYFMLISNRYMTPLDSYLGNTSID